MELLSKTARKLKKKKARQDCDDFSESCCLHKILKWETPVKAYLHIFQLTLKTRIILLVMLCYLMVLVTGTKGRQITNSLYIRDKAGCVSYLQRISLVFFNVVAVFLQNPVMHNTETCPFPSKSRTALLGHTSLMA